VSVTAVMEAAVLCCQMGVKGQSMLDPRSYPLLPAVFCCLAPQILPRPRPRPPPHTHTHTCTHNCFQSPLTPPRPRPALHP